MKISKESYQRAKTEKQLFDQGKISFYNSAENIQALCDIVRSRRNNIQKAAKALGIKIISP
jgi:hypothetical protein